MTGKINEGRKLMEINLDMIRFRGEAEKGNSVKTNWRGKKIAPRENKHYRLENCLKPDQDPF